MEEEMIILEILDRSGRVRERVRLSSFPVTIGRAYDNHIILDDEYVSPRHLTIDRDEQGALRIVDLRSENGLYRMPSLTRVDAVPIAADNQLLVGSTHIRIRRPDFDVAPTRRADRRRRSAQNMLASGWLFLPVLLTAAGLLFWNEYSTAFRRMNYQELALGTISTLLALMMWAGLWAFIGRVLGHRSVFFAHANIVLLALLLMSGLDHFIDQYRFAFSAVASADLIETLTLTLLGGMLLFAHLKLATQLRRRKVAVASGLAACGVLAIVLFAEHVKEDTFSTALSYPSALGPAAKIAGDPLSPEEFFSRAQALKEKLEQARLEDARPAGE